MCETTARTCWSRSRSRTDKPIEATLELWASSLREVKTQMRPLDAAFVNAISANLLDYDDTHLDTIIHPTAPVAPALLALAEQRGLSGAEVLHAFIVGVEVECRHVE